MHSKFHKMLEKKRSLSPSEKSAKMDVLKDLKGAASEAMGHKLDGLKKVSVMSNSPEGMQHGLQKAQDMMGQSSDQGDSQDAAGYSEGGSISDEEMTEDKDSQESPNHELAESADEESMEQGHEDAENMDLAAIEAKIQHLMSLQSQMKAKQ